MVSIKDISTVMDTYTLKGDSLAGRYPEPKKFMRDVQSWLRSRFDGPFEDRGDSLVHGNQQDGFSCLICAANMATHVLFGDKLWTPSRRSIERIEWFLKLVRDPGLMVSLSLDCNTVKGDLRELKGTHTNGRNGIT
jgi:hypothetical protein